MKSYIIHTIVLAGMALPIGFAQSTSAPPPTESQEAAHYKARSENQQDRIAQGIDSGRLTAGQAAKLESNKAKINREIARDRARNGGQLTEKQERQVHRQMNRQSRAIYRKKH